MRTLRRPGVIFLLALMGLSTTLLSDPRPAAAVVFSDDFGDNTTDFSIWTIVQTGSGPTAVETNQRLEVHFPATSSGAHFGAAYLSRCALSGDFDTQADYELLNWPTPDNGVRIGLSTTVTGPVERISDLGYGGEVYLTHFGDGILGQTATSDTSGKLRLERVGTSITGYYFDSGSWVAVHTWNGTPTTDTQFSITAWSHDWEFADQEVRVAFDNFVVNSGQLVCPRPVLLIHGWGGNCGSTDGLETYLDANGWAGRYECFAYDHKVGAASAAEALSAYVSGFKSRMGIGPSDQFDIIAHSFGGLVARYYIEERGGAASVANLVMLGTPNDGLSVAALGYLGWRICKFTLFASLCQLYGQDLALRDMANYGLLVSELLSSLNDGFSQPTTAYQVYAGTADHSNLYLGILPDTVENDCLVPTSSASGPQGLPTTPVDATHTTGGMVALLCPIHLVSGTPGLLSSNSPAFDLLKQVLLGVGGAGASASASQLPKTAGAQQSGGAAVLGSAAGQLDPSAIETADFLVSGSSSVGFLLLWTGSEDAELRVRRPDGALVNPADADAEYTNIGAIESSGLSGKQYMISSPAEGNWTVEAEGTGLTTPVAYSIVVTGDSSISMSLNAAPAFVEVGNPVVVTATLVDGGSPITGASVDGQVQEPAGAVTPLVLVDDGSGADAVAGDGIYSASIAGTAMCGDYAVIADGTGVVASTSFARQSFVEFTASVPGGTLADSCSAGAVGGIAELPEIAETPLEESDSSGGSAGVVAGVIAAVAAGALTLGGAAWYVRRRWRE